MDVSSLTFLGTIAHILGPIYLSECFPACYSSKVYSMMKNKMIINDQTDLQSVNPFIFKILEGGKPTLAY